MKRTMFAATALAAALTAFGAQAREAWKFAGEVPAAKLAEPAAFEPAVLAHPRDAMAARSAKPAAVARPKGDEPKAAEKRPVLNAIARKGSKVKGGIETEQVAAIGKVGKVRNGRYGSIITRYAATYGVPIALAHAVISVESNYRANARGAAGEIGLMQIKPATARAMGYSGKTAGLFNPETNIRFGMKYLGMAHRLSGGATCGTILRYNAGHGARRMNPVSAAYCRKVRRLGA